VSKRGLVTTYADGAAGRSALNDGQTFTLHITPVRKAVGRGLQNGGGVGRWAAPGTSQVAVGMGNCWCFHWLAFLKAPIAAAPPAHRHAGAAARLREHAAGTGGAGARLGAARSGCRTMCLRLPSPVRIAAPSSAVSALHRPRPLSKIVSFLTARCCHVCPPRAPPDQAAMDQRISRGVVTSAVRGPLRPREGALAAARQISAAFAAALDEAERNHATQVGPGFFQGPIRRRA
jgi:hypothetical protein